LCKNGEYVWIRDVVHVVRNADGSVDSLIGFMFDISERKRTEQKLIDMQKELEELSFKDGLTNVANRRRFDAIMELEWANARRNKQPLSLVMLDIDYFKQYNDHFGHLEGDQCLKQVARILEMAATRARDFVARFGGEEFVLVLPETDESAALKVAERCRELIANEQIAHLRSGIGAVLTVSMGVGTTIPAHGDELLPLVEMVDRRLYQAKQQGKTPSSQQAELRPGRYLSAQMRCRRPGQRRNRAAEMSLVGETANLGDVGSGERCAAIQLQCGMRAGLQPERTGTDREDLLETAAHTAGVQAMAACPWRERKVGVGQHRSGELFRPVTRRMRDGQGMVEQPGHGCGYIMFGQLRDGVGIVQPRMRCTIPVVR
jgi:diguanylate cyclase (GGDEF)-like protein